MLYCEKCRSICPDSTEKCPACKSVRLRAVNGEDMVLLHRADQYTAGRLAEQFDEAGVLYQLEPFSKGKTSYLYDCEVMPTDKNIYVRYEDLPAAKEFSAQMKAELEQQAGEEEFEEMPRKKRILVQVLSLLGFFLLVILAVFGADALANWLKSIF
ncbi:hypothetical protein [Neglectibacter caecimuris]|uniref:hypothetical protein n=1 Tax=Neglectibacter caecimuris TaxID=3093658 RepID=UPI002AC99F86|nr:hypothetical protein [Neglectibacter sp. M00184]